MWFFGPSYDAAVIRLASQDKGCTSLQANTLALLPKFGALLSDRNSTFFVCRFGPKAAEAKAQYICMNSVRVARLNLPSAEPCGRSTHNVLVSKS